MSELKSTLFGENDEEASDIVGNEEITGQVTLTDTYYDPSLTADGNDPGFQDDAEALNRESMDAVERMKNEIAAETKDLDRRFEQTVIRKAPQEIRKRRPTYVIGVLSGAASLIFMGFMLLISLLSSPIGAYAAIKLSPVVLIFLGAEIIFAMLKRRTLRIKIDIRSMIMICSLIVISAALAVISVTASAGKGERVFAEQRIRNMLASEIHDRVAHDNIRSVDIETQLFGEDAEMYRTPADLTEGDIINLTVNYSDAQMPIRDFAKECRAVLDGLAGLSYNFGSIGFIADDRVNHYVLNVDWHYQSDYSADKLASFVNYYGDDISDTDIPDLPDE
ncbi:MAG: hypothetical protein IJT87_13290 [Ruminiclostridium sp.]|nr:hypothetical protein [Ruminiclostridium sp.]